ncbi:MAG: hypothetical protein B6I26_07445 [Desulfobacteraceae bacterium 4572_130]|nr:MAG: hypothetical protein B6I26_07445 [Desulfobacteraceae bacterium 4572_130]
MDNELLNNKFIEINKKIDSLIELCEMLQQDNIELISKNKNFENNKNQAEERYNKEQAVTQSRLDGLISKLDNFSDTP